MKPVDVPLTRSGRQGPSFALSQRLHRVLWKAAWALFASWTPASFSPWRIQLLKLFGARVHSGAAIASSARVWLPRNLELGSRSVLGPGVDCYNMGMIRIGTGVVVSQRAVLCGGTHDIHDELFQLKVAPITIGDHVWIASEAFVGPGVHIGEGCVLGARGCAFSDLDPWTVYRGNPAVRLKERGWRRAATPVQDLTVDRSDPGSADPTRKLAMVTGETPLAVASTDATTAGHFTHEAVTEDLVADADALRTRRF